MDWQQDPTTAQAAQDFPLPISSPKPALQFSGCNTNPARWKYPVVLDSPCWPEVQPLTSSPDNIIDLFKRSAFLEALALVVSWGGMGRQLKRIYCHRHLPVIHEALKRCAVSIRQTHSIRCAWDYLTGNSPDQLGWSAVIASKTLSFLARALEFDERPPVAIDNAVIRQQVWPAFVRGIPEKCQRPRNWEGNTFGAYSRYMTAILVWALQRQWTTTELEATIFDEYSHKKG
jgi:hypothetical protein